MFSKLLLANVFIAFYEIYSRTLDRRDIPICHAKSATMGSLRLYQIQSLQHVIPQNRLEI